jgi:uncharacterized Zn-finger protein
LNALNKASAAAVLEQSRSAAVHDSEGEEKEDQKNNSAHEQTIQLAIETASRRSTRKRIAKSMFESEPKLSELTNSKRPTKKAKTSTEQETFECRECEKTFKKKYRLRQHQLTHSSSSYTLKCPEPGCKSLFNKKYNLERHKLIHTGEKPFKCPLCDENFRVEHHLIPHINSHKGARPFKCSQCEYRSGDNSNVARHFKAQHLS